MTNTVYEEVTSQIINALEKGVVPWQRPWVSCGQFPENLTIGKRYRGINIILLSLVGEANGYNSPYWLTYKQARSLGGWVKRGEKGTKVVFWNINEKEDDDGEKHRYGFLRQYTVFNTDQCENLEKRSPRLREYNERKLSVVFNPIEKAEKIVAGYKGAPSIAHDGGDRAYYVPIDDSVHLPVRTNFISEGEYYGTVFHELGHSTGSKGRLDRSGLKERHNKGEVNEEELIAEFCAAFLCSEAGIERTVDNSAAYIKSWLRFFKGDKKVAVVAASKAQKAAEYITEGVVASKGKNRNQKKSEKVSKVA